MKILIECGVRVPLPVKLYGGTQRVLWDLASELSRLGHKITLLAAAGTVCPFAERVIVRDPSLQLKEQIPDDVDVCHFNNFVVEKLDVPKPYVITMHGNVAPGRPMDKNTIFVSKNHASRYGADAFVYNGLDWSNSPKYQQNATRDYFHFIGKGTFKVKNLPGTIKLFQRYADKRCGERFVVMGGTRLQIKHGFRYTFDRRIDFLGMVDDGQKYSRLQHSKGLFFPVLWHEPFGLAIIESLYMGAPVFGTPFGSLPELVHKDVGFLSESEGKIVERIDGFQNERVRGLCHEYAQDSFNSLVMAKGYLLYYEKVLNGESCNATFPETTVDTKNILRRVGSQGKCNNGRFNAIFGELSATRFSRVSFLSDCMRKKFCI